MDDVELLNRYATSDDEAAFAELVARRLPLVLATAKRQVGNRDLAEEVAQAVFVILARKAGRLDRNVVLSGWLYQTTRYVCQKAVRTEIRRSQREREAVQRGPLMDSSEAETNENEVVTRLDDMLGRLRDGDRSVLVLRYFEGMSLAQIGERLGTSEDAAQKRVTRALDRLRRLFGRRSITVSSGVLATVMGGQAGAAVPSGLAAGITLAAVSGIGVAPVTTNLVNATIGMMTWIKIKSLAPIGAAVALAAGVPITGMVKKQSALNAANDRLRATEMQLVGFESQEEELATLRNQVAEMERLRERANEVHKLRAQVAQLGRERDGLLARLASLEARPPVLVAASSVDVPIEEVDAPADRLTAMRGLKLLALSLIIYAEEHDGQFPQSMADLDTADFENEDGGLTLDDLVMIDYGDLSTLADRAQSVIFATKEPFETDSEGFPRWGYSFADGHAEVSRSELGEYGRLIR